MEEKARQIEEESERKAREAEELQKRVNAYVLHYTKS